MTDKEFIAKIKPYVIEDMKQSGILASLTMAQAFIESGKGNSGLTVRANNLFGIKGSYNGNSIKMLTTEYRNGVKVKEYADFKVYPTWLHSIQDHSAFLKKYKRYASIIGETNYKEVSKKIGASGYATDPDYEQTILKTIETYKFYEIDNEVLGTDYKPTVVEKVEKAPTYKVGTTYVLTANLFVRTSPAGEKALLSQLSKNAKLHAYDDGNGFGILRKGTKVTCQKVVNVGSDIWIKIPSGYVCALNNGKRYIE